MQTAGERELGHLREALTQSREELEASESSRMEMQRQCEEHEGTIVELRAEAQRLQQQCDSGAWRAMCLIEETSTPPHAHTHAHAKHCVFTSQIPSYCLILIANSLLILCLTHGELCWHQLLIAPAKSCSSASTLLTDSAEDSFVLLCFHLIFSQAWLWSTVAYFEM